uniref:Uncharacterized protein n=1 Tax=Avena sativa TaxID=4498 RepID=A0ACD5TYQ0_AVESA
MAIVRNSGARVPRLDGAGEEGSPEATEDEDEQSPATASRDSDAEGFSGEEANGGGSLEEEAEEEDDSGMGSDELEITQLGEAGAEMSQVGDQSVAVPLELYDLADGFSGVLSLDAWNGLLTEDERLRLAAFLPDLDQETFARTLVELLSGENFHFGSPLAALFDRLKGGLCDPRIVLYRRGARFAERRKHYYHLQSYHNSMVRGLWEAKDCWKSCDGYSLGERLRALDAMKAQRKQKLLGLDARAGSETDSESRESAEQFMTRPRPDKMSLKKAGKEKSKGLLRLGGSKGLGEDYIGGSGRDAAVVLSGRSRQDNAYGYDMGVMHRGKPRRSVDGLDSEDLGYDRDLPRVRSQKPLVKPVKKKEFATGYDSNPYAKSYRDNHTGSHYHGRNAVVNQGVTLAASFEPPYAETARNAKYMERDRIYGGKSVLNKALKDEMDWPAASRADNLNDWQRGQPAGHYRSRIPQVGQGVKVKSYRNIEQQMNGAHSGFDPRDKVSQGKVISTKARGHPMLLPDRPPHVTILCLVRDAASRLPGRTGTRADVCTLLKDSQYLNHAESNKEAAVNQVVSGALDRLHYERDPCVLYDNDKKLWTYLHRGREEEDFEDDGTSSTKKWKRPRRDSLDPSEAGAGNDDIEDDGTPNTKKQKKDDAEPTASGEDKDGMDHVIQDPSNGGLEGGLDLDVVLSSTNNEETAKPVSTDVKPDIGISRPSVGATAGNTANDNSARIPEQFYSMALPVDSTSNTFK